MRRWRKRMAALSLKRRLRRWSIGSRPLSRPEQGCGRPSRLNSRRRRGSVTHRVFRKLALMRLEMAKDAQQAGLSPWTPACPCPLRNCGRL